MKQETSHNKRKRATRKSTSSSTAAASASASSILQPESLKGKQPTSRKVSCTIQYVIHHHPHFFFYLKCCCFFLFHFLKLWLYLISSSTTLLQTISFCRSFFYVSCKCVCVYVLSKFSCLFADIIRACACVYVSILFIDGSQCFWEMLWPSNNIIEHHLNRNQQHQQNQQLILITMDQQRSSSRLHRMIYHSSTNVEGYSLSYLKPPLSLLDNSAVNSWAKFIYFKFLLQIHVSPSALQKKSVFSGFLAYFLHSLLMCFYSHFIYRLSACVCICVLFTYILYWIDLQNAVNDDGVDVENDRSILKVLKKKKDLFFVWNFQLKIYMYILDRLFLSF